MAASSIARGLSRSASASTSSTSRAFFGRNAAGKTKLGGSGIGFSPYSSSSTPSSFTSQNRRFLSSFRLVRTLGCVENMMPLHSVTASALLNSMLSVETRNWAWLSEGFASTV